MAVLERSPGVDIPRSAAPVALFLTANGVEIEGDSTQALTEGAIECVSFLSSVTAAARSGTGMATGRRNHEGISVRKRVDRATPLLARALCNNELIEATFKFFRPNPAGDGTTEHFFTVEIDKARLTAIQLVSPDGYSNQDAPPAIEPFEDVQFAYNEITWRYEPTGVEHKDSIAVKSARKR
jgi:type VI secretion system secreted protein Hcp